MITYPDGLCPIGFFMLTPKPPPKKKNASGRWWKHPNGWNSRPILFLEGKAIIDVASTCSREHLAQLFLFVKSQNLIGGLEHFVCFHMLGIITPTDFHIFQRDRYTTNQFW